MLFIKNWRLTNYFFHKIILTMINYFQEVMSRTLTKKIISRWIRPSPISNPRIQWGECLMELIDRKKIRLLEPCKIYSVVQRYFFKVRNCIRIETLWTQKNEWITTKKWIRLYIKVYISIRKKDKKCRYEYKIYEYSFSFCMCVCVCMYLCIGRRQWN